MFQKLWITYIYRNKIYRIIFNINSKKIKYWCSLFDEIRMSLNRNKYIELYKYSIPFNLSSIIDTF